MTTLHGTWPSVDHSLLSPSGHMSKRARAAASERLRVELFGEEGLAHPEPAQPTDSEAWLRKAANLREMAARGMHPRKYVKEAERLEALAAGARP